MRSVVLGVVAWSVAFLLKAREFWEKLSRTEKKPQCPIPMSAMRERRKRLW